MLSRRHILTLLCIAGTIASAAGSAAAQSDHTRRGLNRAPSSQPAAPPQQAAPPPARPAPAIQQAPPQQRSAPSPTPSFVPQRPMIPPPRAFTPAPAPRTAPTAVAPPKPLIGTPQRPATSTQARRTLSNLTPATPAITSPALAPSAPRLQSDTTRRSLAKPLAAPAPSAPAPMPGRIVHAAPSPDRAVASIAPRAPSSASFGAARAPSAGLMRRAAPAPAPAPGLTIPTPFIASDHTRNNLVRTINSDSSFANAGNGRGRDHRDGTDRDRHGGDGRAGDFAHRGGSWRGSDHFRSGWYGSSYGSPYISTYFAPYGGVYSPYGPYTTYSAYHDPFTSWSTGLTFGSLSSCGGYARDPWSYSSFSYAGPGLYASSGYTVQPYDFSYDAYAGSCAGPYAGPDAYTQSAPVYAGGSTIIEPYSVGTFSSEVPAAPTTTYIQPAPPVVVEVPAETAPLPRVYPSYDIRSDLIASVEDALRGEYSASIFSMRKAAGLNPAALVGPAAPSARAIAADPQSSQRVRAALRIYRAPPQRVVSETDAQFMIAALSATLGETEAASFAADSALIAGDESASTRLLGKAIRGEPLDSAGPWVPGRVLTP